MFESVILLLYAILIMTMFLDIRFKEMTTKKKTAMILGVIGILTINALTMHLLGQVKHGVVYPLLVQLPVFLGFSVLSRYKGIKLLFVLLSTVIFSAPPIMCVTAIRTFYNIGKPILLIVFFLGCILMLFITYKYLKKDFNYIL